MENTENCEKNSPDLSTLEHNDEGILVAQQEDGRAPNDLEALEIHEDDPNPHDSQQEKDMNKHADESSGVESNSVEEKKTAEEVLGEEKENEPVFDGTETPELEATRSSSSRSLDLDTEARGSAWPEKAVALKNFVKEKGAVAVSSVLRRLSSKKYEDENILPDSEENNEKLHKGIDGPEDSTEEAKTKVASQKVGEWSTWNPLNFIKTGRDVESQNKAEQPEGAHVEYLVDEPAMKGRIIVYTRLGCQESKDVRLFMHQKRLKYIEINIDVYPSRKLELEKNTGSPAVPCVFFNDLLIGGLSELNALDESGKLMEKINVLVNEEPSPAAPLPPLPGEDDVSGCGTVDELASIVRKMKESIILKDRFYKMRRFNNCFLGSEAVDFLAEDQYLEREEAVEFGRKLSTKHFFRHVLDENTFEDGNHLYRFLEHDPIVYSQCYNMPRGINDVKPKPIIEISSRLRYLSFAIFEAYVSQDGKHVDYRSIHGSEEFRRYLRIIEELQRVDLRDMSREEKLAFFINLYNMMAIHAILTWGYPVGALERRKFLGDFKYVVGGCPYSLSAIQNGILRGNQRPPYNLTKPFGPRDRRSKVALPYVEPLIHFALVCGTRSGPALRCYSPGNIDKELMESARSFLRNGGLLVDIESKVASVSKILRWYSVDFGKDETDVMKHGANYVEPSMSEKLLELLADAQLKVTYQPFDWDLNY
uniref:Vacuolar membrane-associated protein iml1 n=1 Tax=Anthurium amnicola TaxID=1678845 RepID=A0A1D1ZF71_9ARAE